jgi:hypothetical protein
MKDVTTGGAPSMTRKKPGLMGRIMRDMDKHTSQILHGTSVHHSSSHFAEKL